MDWSSEVSVIVGAALAGVRKRDMNLPPFFEIQNADIARLSTDNSRDSIPTSTLVVRPRVSIFCLFCFSFSVVDSTTVEYRVSYVSL